MKIIYNSVQIPVDNNCYNKNYALMKNVIYLWFI